MPSYGLKNSEVEHHQLEPKSFDDLNTSSASSDTGISEDEDTFVTAKQQKIYKSTSLVSTLNSEMDKRYESIPNRDRHEKFLRELIDQVLNKAVFDGTKRENKVVEFNSPEELKKKMDMTLKVEPDSEETLLQLALDTIKYSVKTGHPYFVNQLFSAVDPFALAGQIITDALNPSIYTFEVSPVFILMEEVVLKEMREIVGYPNGSGDGIFCPGGSAANGYAISCARYKAFPDTKTKGLHGLPRLVVFTSNDAHYSVKKLASFMGIGTDNVYLIDTDEIGKMNVEHLEKEILRAIQEGASPFMVSATAGTTVLGAFDPLEKIADLCQKYNLWMHVDAAWGGGALMSQKYRGLLKGIERSDSVTWNPHKLLCAPQQCSTFLLRHDGILSDCHSSNATYLFQKDKFYDVKYDTGDKHIQCGRRADVFKFWYMWRAKGTSGFEKHIDTVFGNAEFFTEEIKKRSGFEMVLENPECTNVCFWYVPPSLRNVEQNASFKEKLHKVAPKIKERMMKEGSMMITYQPINNKPNFFRFVLQNSALTQKDMIYFVDEIERLGADL